MLRSILSPMTNLSLASAYEKCEGSEEESIDIGSTTSSRPYSQGPYLNIVGCFKNSHTLVNRKIIIFEKMFLYKCIKVHLMCYSLYNFKDFLRGSNIPLDTSVHVSDVLFKWFCLPLRGNKSE